MILVAVNTLTHTTTACSSSLSGVHAFPEYTFMENQNRCSRSVRICNSLAEEADALRSVLAIAGGDKKVRNLNPSLAKLKKLNDEGLLEAYILLARTDQGIRGDHPVYLRQNRDKLRRYVAEYILTGGGR